MYFFRNKYTKILLFYLEVHYAIIEELIRYDLYQTQKHEKIVIKKINGEI